MQSFYQLVQIINEEPANKETMTREEKQAYWNGKLVRAKQIIRGIFESASNTFKKEHNKRKDIIEMYDKVLNNALRQMEQRTVIYRSRGEQKTVQEDWKEATELPAITQRIWARNKGRDFNRNISTGEEEQSTKPPMSVLDYVKSKLEMTIRKHLKNVERSDTDVNSLVNKLGEEIKKAVRSYQ